MNLWESQHGKFKILKTTSEGNCFFSALFKAGLGFKSEVEARASLVQAIKDDEFLYFHIWNFIVHGKISNDHGLMNGFRDHVKLLAMNGTWARTCDIYMAAVAFKVDLVSIHKTSDTVIRPMNYSHLFKYVDGLKNLIGMVLRRRFIGNVAHGASTVENHFVFLDPINESVETLWNENFMQSCSQPLQDRAVRRVFEATAGGNHVAVSESEPDNTNIENYTNNSITMTGNGNHSLQFFVGENTNANITMNSHTEAINLDLHVEDNVSVEGNVENAVGFSLNVKRKRNIQQVVRNGDRITVAKWMVNQEQNGTTEIPSKALDKFPQFFRSAVHNSNLQRASRWFKSRHDIVKSIPTLPRCITSNHRNGPRKKSSLKTTGGRGRKRAEWVEWLHEKLFEEFERLSSAGVKFSRDILQQLAKELLCSSTHETFRADYVDQKDKKGQKVIEKINYGWITAFMERYNIVQRQQTGKLMLSKEKQSAIEREVAYHLGCVKRQFDNGELDEDLIENMDETHFVINMDNGKTLAMKGAENVKYADVVSGGEGMTMIVRITGGVNAKVYPSMMIFKNKDRNYPIRGLIDDVEGVSYRTGPKGWMDKRVFVQWLDERRANPRDRYGRTKVIFMDNCGGHNETPESVAALQRLNAIVRKLPANATDLCQPADSFIISKIKDSWSKHWDRKKSELIRADKWSNDTENQRWSGKLKNPGKRFYLNLAVQAVKDVNEQRDEFGMSYARKAMIKCGLSKDAVSGEWKETQLFEDLQNIINRNRDYFEGKLVPEEYTD